VLLTSETRLYFCKKHKLGLLVEVNCQVLLGLQAGGEHRYSDALTE